MCAGESGMSVLIALASFTTNIPWYYWFILGFIFFLAGKFIIPKIRRKAPAWEQTEKPRRFTTEYLSLAVIIGGFAISIYGIYLTAQVEARHYSLPIGSDNMTANEYQNLANQLYAWIGLYTALLWVIAGIAVGGVIWFFYSLIFKRKVKEGDRITTISTKELDSTKKRVKEFKQVKDDLDDFFKGIKDD
jgi:hypothetical protein